MSEGLIAHKPFCDGSEDIDLFRSKLIKLVDDL